MNLWDKIRSNVVAPDDDYYDEQEDVDIPEAEPEEDTFAIRRAKRAAARADREESVPKASPIFRASPISRASSSEDKVVDIHTTAKLQVVLRTPKGEHEDAFVIADDLNKKRTVVLNLEKCEKNAATRLIDFLQGVTYANEGKLKMIASNIVIITPYNVDVMGDLLDNLESSGLFFN
ncbi:MAG: cell division protein SepF [Clostridia bacterium]|nr:cell division protein SepF [Clostridia bacterium]